MGLQEKTRKIWAASEASRRKKKMGLGGQDIRWCMMALGQGPERSERGWVCFRGGI